jgi:hypothetical protein
MRTKYWTTDPAFKVNADPDADPNPDQGFDNQKFTKIYTWKNVIF